MSPKGNLGEAGSGKAPGAIQNGCSGQRRVFQGSPSAQVREGHVQVGLRPEIEPDSYSSSQARRKGEHHVRTLYGEGAARNILCAV